MKKFPLASVDSAEPSWWWRQKKGFMKGDEAARETLQMWPNWKLEVCFGGELGIGGTWIDGTSKGWSIRFCETNWMEAKSLSSLRRKHETARLVLDKKTGEWQHASSWRGWLELGQALCSSSEWVWSCSADCTTTVCFKWHRSDRQDWEHCRLQDYSAPLRIYLLSARSETLETVWRRAVRSARLRVMSDWERLRNSRQDLRWCDVIRLADSFFSFEAHSVTNLLLVCLFSVYAQSRGWCCRLQKWSTKWIVFNLRKCSERD